MTVTDTDSKTALAKMSRDELEIELIKMRRYVYNVRLPNSRQTYGANIGQLEAEIGQLKAEISQLNRDNASLNNRLLRLGAPDGERVSIPSADQIIKRVCAIYNVTRDDVMGRSRLKDICRARHTIAALLYLIPAPTGRRRSFPEIARELKREDHTTIQNSIRRWMQHNGFAEGSE